MKDGPDVYRKLREQIDRMPVGFPATESGVEIRVLKRLFTEEEAEAALLLSALPEPLEKIFARAPRGKWTRESFEALLAGLVEKGAIMGGRSPASSGAVRRYSRAMLAIGMYEMQVDRLTPELQRDLEQYLAEGFAAAFFGPKTKQMRTVPVDVRIVPDRSPGRYDDVRSLIGDSRGPWAVLNCVCRQGKDLAGEPCRQSAVRRTCLAMKGAARSVVESGAGEELTREEALALLDRAAEEGLVLQPQNSQDPMFVCFCCGCCCGVLRMAKQFPRPADVVESNYRVAVERDLCADCAACRDRCPMEALSESDGRTAVDEGRCIGCGACVGTCPSDALRLVEKERPHVPPQDHAALYRKILVERFGILGTAKIMGKAVLGRRV